MPLLYFARVCSQVRESELSVVIHTHVVVFLGILSACELLVKLSCDRVLPRAFLATVPATGAPYVTVISFIAFSALIYASTGASLIVISQMCVSNSAVSVVSEI
jgi:hypothetical protein